MAGYRVIVFACALVMVACNTKSEFSSSAGKVKRESKEQDSDAKASESDPRREDEPSDEPAGSGVLPATDTPSVEGAVTKGSFTAWADPANPQPGQAYWIHIEVQLPSNVQSYVQTDLSGSVTGTDMYQRGIGRDSRGAGGSSFGPTIGDDHPDQFEFLGAKAQIAVWVPGAMAMVRDTIRIRSDLLNEEQSLEIVFQGSGAGPGGYGP